MGRKSSSLVCFASIEGKGVVVKYRRYFMVSVRRHVHVYCRLMYSISVYFKVVFGACVHVLYRVSN